MLKVIVLADTPEASRDLLRKIQDFPQFIVIATLLTHEYNAQLANKYKADLIITNSAAANNLQVANKEALARKQVTASTHHGVRTVPIANIYYFQAELKYVTVNHTHGQLLIEDSLNSLEREFAPDFIRIHRKTLVAKNRIEILAKNSAGKYYVKLHDRNEELMVSRRQLPQVRKLLTT